MVTLVVIILKRCVLAIIFLVGCTMNVWWVKLCETYSLSAVVVDTFLSCLLYGCVLVYYRIKPVLFGKLCCLWFPLPEFAWIIISKIMFCFTVFLSLIWFSNFVSFHMWNFSKVSIIFPFFIICKIFIIPSIGPIACLFWMRCCANLEFQLPYLKSLKCSWNLMWNGLSVWPVYFSLQSLHFSW